MTFGCPVSKVVLCSTGESCMSFLAGNALRKIRMVFVCVLQSSGSCSNIVFWGGIAEGWKGATSAGMSFRVDRQKNNTLLACRPCIFHVSFWMTAFFPLKYFLRSNRHYFQDCLQVASAMVEKPDHATVVHRLSCGCRGKGSFSKVFLLMCYL